MNAEIESIDTVAFQRELRKEALKLREEALQRQGLRSKVVDASKLPSKPQTLVRPGKVVAASTLVRGEPEKLPKKRGVGKWVAASTIQHKEGDSPKSPKPDSKKPKLK